MFILGLDIQQYHLVMKNVSIFYIIRKLPRKKSKQCFSCSRGSMRNLHKLCIALFAT